MIASLTGEVISIEADTAIIDVNGVGYAVRMSSKDLSQIHTGQTHMIHTIMTVSQDAIALYGFLHTTSQKLFIQLQKVSGVGPRVALSVLSTMTPDQLASAIRNNDSTALTKTPGLGKKGAQKIILELSGSLDISALNNDGKSNISSEETDIEDTGTQQVVTGLISLGWQ